VERSFFQRILNRPLDAPAHQFQKVVVLESLCGMSKAGVKYATFTVGFRPCVGNLLAVYFART
jgi:hypothetical protein